MKLALFTPGAYIWPVERSFEGFIHSLGGFGTDADNVTASTVYPADSLADAQAAMPAALSARLVKLHRDLYDALLRPVEFFRTNTATLAEQFYPDLAGTQVDALMSALLFFFLRYSGAELTVPRGLSVLRAVFFNHEAAEPELWLYSALDRLRSERNARSAASLTVSAPLNARFQGLAFALIGARDLPPTSAQMIIGEARRTSDFHLEIKAEYGVDPSWSGAGGAYAEYAQQAVTACLASVFGWQEVPAA